MGLYMLRGKGGAWWLPTIADGVQGGGPTLAEVTAGQAFSGAFNAISGLARQRNPINVPVMKHRVEQQIAGPETFQSVSITIPEDDGNGTDADALERIAILTAAAEDSTGWLLLCRTAQVLTASTPVFFIGLKVDDQEPNWDLGATAAMTNLNLTPSTPLFKGTVQAS
ncbi:hypothetical protein [Cellulomonas sp. C5510]|uniref:phage tail tube protein n=1 Tax=Cellulomonas sp. C5510 TaxID=2871170 RepID=UPI001C988039|nr:hypothetical protein [Cellulomonas sp. C5510]QZN86879.1 hypothetical protein K5O09_07150 [Cellulomonas sp. C5510]